MTWYKLAMLVLIVTCVDNGCVEKGDKAHNNCGWLYHMCLIKNIDHKDPHIICMVFRSWSTMINVRRMDSHGIHIHVMALDQLDHINWHMTYSGRGTKVVQIWSIGCCMFGSNILGSCPLCQFWFLFFHQSSWKCTQNLEPLTTQQLFWGMSQIFMKTLIILN